jgi:hypothetical protein
MNPEVDVRGFCLGLMLSWCSIGASQGLRTIDLHVGRFEVGQGEVRSLRFERSYDLHKILVQAESQGSQNSFFDVIANGETVGTIMTPGSDPTYIVTVNKKVESLQFRSLSGGGFRILKVLGIVGNTPIGDIGFPDINRVTKLALKTIQTITKVEEFATPLEQWHFTLPIKRAAGRVYATAVAHGSRSPLVGEACLELAAIIDSASPFIDREMKRSSSYQAMLELWIVREELRSILGTFYK